MTKSEAWIVASRPYLEKGVGSDENPKIWLDEDDAKAEAARLGPPYQVHRILVEVDTMTSAEENEIFLSAVTARRWTGWAEAFLIFAKYSSEDQVDGVAAEHDEVFAGPDPRLVTPGDRRRLAELGWCVVEEHNCWRRFT